MFKSAKIKLTAWYVSLIMMLTLSFSTLVYVSVVKGTERALESQRKRFERQINDFGPYRKPQGFFINLDEQALKEIRIKTFVTLVGVNTIIFVSSAAIGYFLAGKTLQPIEIMLEKQKRFISDAAHELKTPITALKTNLEVSLRDKELSLDEAKKVMLSSIEETDNLNRLTQKLLNQSKYKNNHITTVVCDLDDLVNKCIDSVINVAKFKNINIEKNLAQIKIKCNKEALSEAVTNIIENAIKYSNANSKVLINLFLEKNCAVLDIHDNGIGILKEDLPHIFDPFYRGDSSRTNSPQNGHGLGLTIAKEIVEQHKGLISIKSKVKKGTIVSIRLPISQ